MRFLSQRLSDLLGDTASPELSLNIKDDKDREARARLFRRWVEQDLGCDLLSRLCFADYMVFQDLTINYPYFYLVASTPYVRDAYEAVVKALVEPGGVGSYSVAFHPDFLGVGRGGSTSPRGDQYWLFSVSSNSETESRNQHVESHEMTSHVYPLDTTRDSGTHSIQDCLSRFQELLGQATITDQNGRPLRNVLCVPFQMGTDEDRPESTNRFERIAAALFLGVSLDGEPRTVVETLQPFVRDLALKTYRSTGISKAASRGEAEGTEALIAAMSHELSKQTTVLFSNRLRRLSDVFQVNESPRTNHGRGVYDWPVPAGRIQADVRMEQAISRWLVCPAPDLLQSIRSYLILWAGSAGSLSEIGVKDRELRAFLGSAVEFAIGGRIAVEMKNYDIKNWEQSIRLQDEAEALRQSMPTVVIDVSRGNGRLPDLDRVEDSRELIVFNRMFRAIVAGVFNALQHAPFQTQIRVAATVRQQQLTIEILNEYSDVSDYRNNLHGTKEVIIACLQGLCDPAQVHFAPMPDSREWRTAFDLPLIVEWRGKKLRILDPSN